MPYAPGIQAQAGEYFSQIGPRLAQNLQSWLKGREERQQTTATAEMIGRYLKDDPKAMEMFGDQLAKVPSMSTGAAKGVIGATTMYLTQQHLKAAEAAQTAQTDLQKQELAIRAGEAAQKLAAQNRLQGFNEQIGQEINPPLMFKSAEGAGPGPLTPETVARVAARAGVLGQPETTALFNAISNYGQRAQGLPLGTEVKTPGGHTLIGGGFGQAPHFVAAKETPPTKGLEFGATKETSAGTLFGMGLLNEPKLITNADKPKLSSADETFLNLAPVYAQQLDDYAKAVDKYGGAEIFDQAGSAALGQLAYQTAISNAKISDPSSVAREGEVASAKKYMIPAGWGTRTKVTKDAIEGARNDLVNRVRTWSENNKGKLPENMPLWLRARLSTNTGDFTSADQVRKALDAGHLTWDEAAAIIAAKKFGGASANSSTGAGSP